MALSYLLDPTNQYQNVAGVNNVAGWFEVFISGTPERADVYVDFAGTRAPERIAIDNDGRAVMVVDGDGVYRVEMHAPNGDLLWTQYPVWPAGQGGDGAIGVDIGSSDGSVDVQRTQVGSVVNYDLSVAADSTDLLGWGEFVGYTMDGTHMVPSYSAGTIVAGQHGIRLQAGQYYHVTVALGASSVEQNVYDAFQVSFRGVDGDGAVSTYSTKSFHYDASTGEGQSYDVSFDMAPATDVELYAEATGLESGISVGLSEVYVHRVYSGAPAIPGGVADREWVEGNYQEKLVAGDNITIDGNVISATGGGGGEYSGADGIIVDNSTMTISADASVLQEKLTAGSNITISGTTISATMPDLSQYVTDYELETILSGYATAQDLAGKQDVLMAGSGIDITNNVISCTAGFTQLPANWAEADPQSVQYIQNKPDLTQYATTGDLNTGLAAKQDVLTPGSNITIAGDTISATDTTYSAGTGLNLSGTEFSVDSTTVAMKSDLPDLSDYVTDSELATILQGYQAALTAGSNIQISNGTISATDTTYSAGTGLSLNGTTFSVDTTTVATQGDLAGKQDVLSAGDGISISSNTVSAKVDGTSIDFNSDGELEVIGGAFTQLQANWNESDTQSVQYIQNKPTVPELKELVAGNNITLTEGANDVTVACSVTIGTVVV